MTTTTQTAFGRVLTGLLEERGIEATPETVGQPVISRMVSTEANHPGPQTMWTLVGELELSDEEMTRLAKAFALEEE